jgi:hypothetical protein
MQSFRNAYSDFIFERTDAGSNKASSYLRALELLGPILANCSTQFARCADVFSIQSTTIP